MDQTGTQAPSSIPSYLIDYDVYVMSKTKRLTYTAMAAVGLFAVGYIFFQNIIVGLVVALGAFWYPKLKVKDLIAKRKQELGLQFKDALYSLSSSLSSGKSLESSFRVALNDLKILYADENTYIIKEFEYICRMIEMNEPVEKALLGFAERSHMEDIKNFADVISICKRVGGNLVEVVKNSSNMIGDKIEIEQEIDVLLSKPKFEQKMLMVMPFLFIAMINLGGSGYTDPLYASPKGYLLMLVALGLIAFSYYISKKLMNIKV